MGFFSWIEPTSGRSIRNLYTGRPHKKPVYMITEDGRQWKEEAYEGYGEFGGKDIYELIAEMNGLKDRMDGISLVYKDNPSGCFRMAAVNGVKLPKLTYKLKEWDLIPYPENCPRQGYF